MNIKMTLFILILFFISILYIRITSNNYFYCSNILININYERNSHTYLCEEVINQAENYFLLKKALKIIYATTNFDDFDNYSKINKNSFFIEMKTLKYIHILLYFILLYCFLIVFPKLFMRIIIYLITNCLFLFFIFLIFEALLNLILGSDFSISNSINFIFKNLIRNY